MIAQTETLGEKTHAGNPHMRFAAAVIAVISAAQIATAEVKPISEPWLKSGETLVCFGDSITASKNQYVKDLTEQLAAKGVKVVNAGKSGDKTPMALTRIKDVAAMNPDAVMFFFGANDSVIGRGRWRDEPVVDPVTYRDNLVWMIHWFRLYTSVKKFSIVAPTGRCEGDAYGEFGDICPKYGLAAREACDMANAVLVPLDTAFAFEQRRSKIDPSEFLLTRDGVHFSRRGSELAASTMLRSWKMD